jgi:1-acyl-sn-glycerol-3-phosphate acyltransferase
MTTSNSLKYIGFLILIVAGMLLFLYLKSRRKALRAKIQLICTCGYLPNAPTDSDDRKMRKVSRFIVWMQIGKVKWSGLENLTSESVKLIVPTHRHYLDPFVLASGVQKGTRVMTASGLLKFAGGLGGLVFSRWGAFCTDLSPGKGLSALRTSVKVLVSGESMVIFPEGWAHLDGVVGSFKSGLASIAHIAAFKSKNPIHIIPVYMKYGKYPGKWIKKFPMPIQCLILLFGLVFFRRGVHVICGKPLLTSDLPKNSKLATEQIRNAVIALKPPL